MRFKKILKNINVLNILLTSAIALVVCFDILYYFDTDIKTALPAINPAIVEPAEEYAAFQSPPMSDFVIVSEQNLFHPERKTPLDKAGETARPEIVLYGTLILGDTAIAYIEDKRNPYSTPGRGKRQKAIKKGEAISGFVLKEVGKDIIVLERGEDKITVTLQEKKDRKPKDKETKADNANHPSSAAKQTFQPIPLKPQNRSAVPAIMPPPR